MNARQSTRTTRLARLVWPYRNSVARGSDKLESATLAIAVVVALLLVPVMLVLGSIAHADMAVTGQQQQRTRHPAVAVLMQDAPAASASGHGNGVGTSMVPATWTNADGSTGKGPVEVTGGQKAGTKVDIWVDQRGRVVDRPLNDADATAGGVLVALTGWLTALLVLGLVQAGLHALLIRRRYRAWDRQWALVEPGWNNFRH